ncbi:MAG: HPP family protein [Thermomicrobia bacterium]|nr:HPP family protein [Thermomicrobia bacterium]
MTESVAETHRRRHAAHVHRGFAPPMHRYGVQHRLEERYGAAGDALYTFAAAFIAIAVSGLAAYLLKQPLLFPSLGPTALLIFGAPVAENASPRNTFIGHGVAIAVGFGSLALFGLMHAPAMLQTGVSPARIGAAAFSVALTGGILILAHALHPPAGATTLIVSLGILGTFHAIIMIALGVVILTVTGWLINRALGVPVPFWAAPTGGS